MIGRKALTYVVSVVVMASMLLGTFNAVVAQNPTPPPPDTSPQLGGPPLVYHGHVTNAERQAAADRAAAMRSPGANVQDVLKPQPGGVPDYWGAYPNWANSQRPQVVAGQVVSGTGIRKFVDTLPQLGKANNLGQYLSVAVADTTTYTNSDYYEIGLVQYEQQLHSDLPPTLLRGYVQLSTAVVPGNHITLTNFVNGVSVPVTDTLGNQVYAVDYPHYLGPVIVAERDKPTRIKFTNFLPKGAGGNLFIPVDTTLMGAGLADDGTSMFTQNRATLHLHGGVTPWISDGTPHQWTTPISETTAYPEGVSVFNVPDMPDPGDGSLTFFYSNQQSARLMFYHDHAYGLTRLNVYAGEAAGYLIQDAVEVALMNGGTLTTTAGTTTTIAAGTIPTVEIPLIIQDKTFVPTDAELALEDPTWVTGTVTQTWGGASGYITTPYTISWGTRGDFWFPHVYMPNQNPYDLEGASAMGRWDYGPWFWPVFDTPAGLVHSVIDNPYYGQGDPAQPPKIPGTPNPSLVPEAFMDTPLVNGTAYPVLDVEPKAYRFRILNAANDRFWNLQLYQAASSASMWNPDGTLNDANAGEVPMVAAVPGVGPACGPNWPTDGRAGGVPDPKAAGPTMIQIGTEGGFLPAPVTLLNTPIGYNYNRRDIVVLNIADKTLLLGPAERADVIVDFSQYAGRTLILYNDAPAPVPAFDTRTDYYTGDPDQRSTGGAPPTLPGYGPNTRTIMQIRVSGTQQPVAAAPGLKSVCPISTFFPLVSGGTGASALPGTFDVGNLTSTWAFSGAGVFAVDQDPIIVPQAEYNSAYGMDLPADPYVRIQANSTSFTPISLTAGVTSTLPLTFSTELTLPLEPKAIQELFEMDYGRMNATLGVELKFTNAGNQTTLPLGYAEPTTEVITDSVIVKGPVAGDGTQLWKITHNGVDTHAIHFHLFNVQVVNRVGWDGAVRPPDLNELGWKETVRMNPLEDIIVALRAVAPALPYGVPNSVRAIDVLTDTTSGTISTFNLTDGRPIVIPNRIDNFGWEYVWHCHLLGHEENDMMRPIEFRVATTATGTPTILSATGSPTVLTWTDPTPVDYNDLASWRNTNNEVRFDIYRKLLADPGYSLIGSALANHTLFTDTIVAGTGDSYQVVAVHASGNTTATFTLP